jgi:hypothetical protein
VRFDRQDLDFKKMAIRMLKAARFNADNFRQLRDSPDATAQSILIIPVIGLCYGSGLGLFFHFEFGLSLLETSLVAAVALIAAFIIAFVWSGTTFLIVTRLFHRTIGYGALARPFFFAWTPGLLFIVVATPLPVISAIFQAAGTVWIAAASVFAVKYAVGISTQQSMLTFIISAVILLLIQLNLPLILQPAIRS